MPDIACPFCGSNCFAFCDRGIKAWAVHCLGCGMDGPADTDRERARLRWNSRVALGSSIHKSTQRDRVNSVQHAEDKARGVLHTTRSTSERELSEAVVYLAATFRHELTSIYGLNLNESERMDKP